MPLFTNPIAIWGSLIFLGLFAVYLYRRRSRRYVVSSLMFFAKSKSTAEGGQKLYKLQTPLIFFIEILILLFLILAMARPLALRPGQLIPITLILDDSLSMTAGGRDSPRAKALAYLEENFFSKELYRFTLIKACQLPQIIGRADLPGVEAENLIQSWNCESVTSNLMLATAQALEMKSEETLIIIITDREIEKASSENIHWLSFGSPLDNLAITAANRVAIGNVDRCFFEFTNFSNSKKEINAEIIDGVSGNILERVTGSLAPAASRRLILKTGSQASPIKAVIQDHGAVYDNEVLLLPAKRQKINVALSFKGLKLQEAVKKALLATERVNFTSNEPHLFISDEKNQVFSSAVSRLFFHSSAGSGYLKDLVAVDPMHPLTADLPIEETLWAVDPEYQPRGQYLVTSGNLPLLVSETLGNTAVLDFNYNFDGSNLHLTSFWPVFFYNLVDWSASRLPGPNTTNYRSGSRIEVFTDKDFSDVYVGKKNAKSLVKHSTYQGKASIVAGAPGLYEIKVGERSYEISVNLCSYEESDLRKAKSGGEMPKIVTDNNLTHFESVKWWFILAAFVLLVLHQWLIRGGSGKTGIGKGEKSRYAF